MHHFDKEYLNAGLLLISNPKNKLDYEILCEKMTAFCRNKKNKEALIEMLSELIKHIRKTYPMKDFLKI